MFSKAFASSGPGASASTGGQYIHFSLYRAPHRGFFDCPFVPNEAAVSGTNFNQGAFGTAIDTSSSSPQLVYHSEKVTAAGKSLYLPPVWNQKVDSYFLKDLLPNTLMIRGIDGQLNDHGLTNAMQVAPQIGTRSINGAVADASTRPIPGIVDLGCPAGGAFKDKYGYAPQAVSYADSASYNPVSTLLLPFTNYKAGRVVHSAQSVAFANQIFARFDDYAQATGVTQSALAKTYENAMQLVDQNITSLGTNSNWQTVKARYKAIIESANDLSGIFDSRISISSDAMFHYGSGASVGTASGDLRDMIVAGQTGNDHLAQNFAIAQLLIGSVTSNMVLNIPGLNRVDVGGGANFTVDNDEHFTGAATSCVLNTVYYRGFLGCMSELISQLKSKNLWNSTVIHVASEFNRISFEGGSQHHPGGSTATLFSGLISAPAVIGNIAINGASGGATDGISAPYRIGSSNRPIILNDVARTITTMMGVEDVVTNGNALMAPKGDGTWVPVSEVANNV